MGGGNAGGWNSEAEPACSALAEYRWATFRLEVLFFFAGYWQAIAASAAAGGGGRSAQEEERLMLEGLVAEIELRHDVAVGAFAGLKAANAGGAAL